MAEIEIKKLRCKRCDHQWVPRTARVFRCPKCMSFRWDEDDAS